MYCRIHGGERMGVVTTERSWVSYADIAKELRRSDRVTMNCHLTYSGISQATLIIGEGMAIDLSTEGLGIQGNQAVEPGMRLTLCLALPDDEGQLLIDEVQVMWARDGRFGVESVRMDKRSRARMDHFLLHKKLPSASNQERVSVRINI